MLAIDERWFVRQSVISFLQIVELWEQGVLLFEGVAKSGLVGKWQLQSLKGCGFPEH
jgi:hypothetical protein